MKSGEQRVGDSSVLNPDSANPAEEINPIKNAMNSVLIVDDEAGIRSFLEKGLSSRFGLIEVAAVAAVADRHLRRSNPNGLQLWRDSPRAVQVMMEVLEAKFEQNPSSRRRLENTGRRYLMEASGHPTWGTVRAFAVTSGLV